MRSPELARALLGATALMLATAAGALEIHGHRGARGLEPENTLAAFSRALEIGVDALELDVGVTRDGVVVVHHDQTLNRETTRDASGEWLAPGTRTPIHALDLDALATLDVGTARPGSAHAHRFPLQRARDGERIPTLAQVIALAVRAGASHVRFNVETKITPDTPTLAPAPDAFADAVIDVLREAGVTARATVQSFDWRVLARVRRVAPEIATGYLSSQRPEWDTVGTRDGAASPWTAGLSLDAHGGSVADMVHAAGGDVWSPDFRDLKAAQLARARTLGLRVVVWTVNTPRDITRMIRLGVDGIISDYPDRVRAAARAAGFTVAPPLAVPR